MSTVPTDRRYAATHEWAQSDGSGVVSVGITDHAQSELGDVVFVELPEIGTHLDAGEQAGVVESVKAASDIYSPISGTVVEINEALAGSPETINADAYGDGWFFRLQPDSADELESLLDADGYAASIDNA